MSPGISSQTRSTVLKYNELYKKLYNREPKDLRILDNDFVIVNETKISIADLKLLVNRLEDEYDAQRKKKRGNIMRLIGWLKGS